MHSITRSPLRTVLLLGVGVLLVLIVRGLDIGPLQTDVIIAYAWFHEVGVRGWTERYLDVNQRHLLVGPFFSFVYWLIKEHSIGYHVIFQASRILEGAFMAGIVFHLTRQRRLLAICAGLALMFTPIRLAELYQGVNWYIEPTLALLLASTYTYLLSIRQPSHRRLWYVTSVLCYAVSVLLYESGLPWIAVTMLAGWVALETLPKRARLWRIVRDAIPSMGVALFLAVIILLVLDPWKGLAPDSGAASPQRLIEQLGTAFTFPDLYLGRLRVTTEDGYLARTVLAAVAFGGGALLLMRITPPDPDHEPFSRDFWILMALGGLMLVCSVLVGTSNRTIRHVFLDRITFGRAAGISLLYVTLIFGAFRLLRARWQTTAAVVSTAVLLLGPGFAWLLTYQDYAQDTRDEIERMTAAVLDIRRVMVAPVHIVIVTQPGWVGSRFPDAHDLLIHEIQQGLWERGGDATIDILRTGNKDFEDDFITYPGTCRTVSGEASSGMCLDWDVVHSSRWATGPTHPDADVVIVRYSDTTGTMTILPEIRMSDLGAYNITTAGPMALKTNPDRLVVPLK
jgi:hypothetical protein